MASNTVCCTLRWSSSAAARSSVSRSGGRRNVLAIPSRYQKAPLWCATGEQHRRIAANGSVQRLLMVAYMDMAYLRRIVDEELDALLPGLAAVSLDGPKGVGKTETATRRARTVFA